MNYHFEKNKNIINGVELVSASEVVSTFFHAFSKSQYLTLMEGLTRREGYVGDPKGMIFYHELDGEDFADGHVFERDEVEIYFHSVGEEVLKEEVFYEIALGYGRALMKAHQSDSLFLSSMSDLLRKLEA